MSQPGSSSAAAHEEVCPTSIACLNNCLASYVEKVHKLNNENARYRSEMEHLEKQLEAYEQTSTGVKARFEVELSQTYARMEEAEKEKAKYQLDARKNFSRIRDLETEVQELKKDLKVARDLTNAAQKSAASADIQRKTVETEKAALEQDIKRLQASIEELRTQLEEEVVNKVKFEKRNTYLTEELALKKATYEAERGRASGGDTCVIYPHPDAGHVQKLIDEVRKTNTKDSDSFKDTLEKRWKKKVSQLEVQNATLSATISQLNEENKKLRSDSASKEEIALLRKKVERLEASLSLKDTELATLMQRHSVEQKSKEEEVCELRQKYDAMEEMKRRLDEEITIYRTLLMKEETSMGFKLTPCCGTKRPSEDIESAAPPAKKPSTTPTRTTDSESIQINEVDQAGRFIEIKNLAPRKRQIGGYKIVHKAEGTEPLTYTFHRPCTLPAKSSIKVWGYEAEGAASSNTATDKIFKDEPTWGVSVNAVTKLITPKNEVIAFFKQTGEVSAASPDESGFFEGETTEQESQVFSEEGGDEEEKGEVEEGQKSSCVIS